MARQALAQIEGKECLIAFRSYKLAKSDSMEWLFV